MTQGDLFAWAPASARSEARESTPQSDPAVTSDHAVTALRGDEVIPQFHPAKSPHTPLTADCGVRGEPGTPQSDPAVEDPSLEARGLRGHPAGCEVAAVTEGSGRSYRLQPPVGRAPTLRPYQLEAISGIEREFERGIRRTLAVLATGLGKTVLFAEWARRRVARGRRVLVVAHRTELLEQAQRKLLDVGLVAGIEQATRRARSEDVVVGSVQTLRAKRLAAFDPELFDVVVDEAHHANAASYRGILEHFTGARVLGVTATPDRGDGKALGEVWQSVAFRYEIREGIRAEYLAPIHARQIILEGVDLSSVRSRAGDLAEDELASILSTEQAVLGQVDAVLREVGDRRAIAFCVNVAHAKAIAEAINRYRAGAAQVAYGELDRDERAAILACYRRGEFQFLVNCELYTEGFDEPSISAVVTLRPTKSRALVVQQVGRGTRLLGATLAESRANGKPNLLWLDVTGNAGRHKLVGPLDALAPGEIADDVRKEALLMLGEEAHDLKEILDEAEQRLEEKRQAARITINAKYFSHDVDPFFGEELGPPILEPWAAEPATDEQRARLLHTVKLKKLPAAITRGEAARILNAAAERKKLGLASYAQQKLLQIAGINAKHMSIANASKRIAILVGCKYDLARARPQIMRLDADEMLAKSGGER